MGDDVVVGGEDTVGEPVVPHELPDVLHDVEFGALRRQWQQGDVRRHDERGQEVPSGLVEQQHGVASGTDNGGDALLTTVPN